MKYKEFIKIAEKNLFIIAEAGVNHNGDVNTAFKLVDAAVNAGCDAVKFQTWITDKVYSRDKSIKPDYQIKVTADDESEYEVIKKLELSFDDFKKIKKYCDDRGIFFLSTPDELDSANFLAQLMVPLMKTASQDVTNIPFLRDISKLGIPIIFSTGACTLDELREGVAAIQSSTDEIIILHCVSSYPAPLEQMNLSLVAELKKIFCYPVGFSDHTIGIEAACAALAFGARVFEKHITLNRAMPGPDHQASLLPDEMANYCVTLRKLLGGIGDGFKKIMPCEENTRNAFRRFIVVSKHLPCGHTISVDDICFKKVVNGIEPKHLEKVLGSKTVVEIESDTILDWSLFTDADN